MTAGQAQVVVGDVAAITQALVVLDQRYRNTPGWEQLAQSARLGWAALAAALDVNLGQPDYTVDELGWRPKTKIIEGPAKEGILGVLQAEHNLIVRMKSFPNATNLRYIIDSQRLLSRRLVPFAARIDPRLAEVWSEPRRHLRHLATAVQADRWPARKGRVRRRRRRQRRQPDQGPPDRHRRRTARPRRVPTALQQARPTHRRRHRGRDRPLRPPPARPTPPSRRRQRRSRRTGPRAVHAPSTAPPTPS